ncbi:Uma2 family endonuclease [Romeria aff. gracilis LEGE 07310]|uniref:Uma2 family endonuclease n=1 Tax=Vasconcelosia minhoensis LEGE 07310 TaxID=915328 RepID=A0A8J7AVM2_9CYAN|nr:Uma2 family endonuclease [Romeria gracilis]MBE9079989.1 Uma2 family endonuclease [Romeria aff. gracilis LEGE 07310]
MGLPTITPDRVELDPGDEIILRFRSWQDYESLLARRLDRAGLRIRYSAETQEIRILSPLPSHGKNADMLADLVKAMLRQQAKDWEAYTSITLKKLGEQGVEPDYCFYLQNRSAVLGKERIDLAIDPPPDLAIEVDFTSRTQPQDYRAITIPELWIYRQSELLIYLHDGSRYQESSSSAQFSEIDLKKLLPQYVDWSWQVGSSVALREFEQEIR